MATPQGRRLGYHTPEQVSNPEPPDSRLCVLTTTLLGGVYVLAVRNMACLSCIYYNLGSEGLSDELSAACIALQGHQANSAGNTAYRRNGSAWPAPDLLHQVPPTTVSTFIFSNQTVWLWI